jgi:hypothetical protein
VALYFSVFEWVMQKEDRFFFLYELPAFRFAKSKRYSVDGLVMFSCNGIQWMDLRKPSFDHVLNVGGDHRLFLGCPLSGYKDSMQGFSGLGVCVFASKAFGLWQRLLGIIYFRFPVICDAFRCGESVL